MKHRCVVMEDGEKIITLHYKRKPTGKLRKSPAKPRVNLALIPAKSPENVCKYFQMCHVTNLDTTTAWGCSRYHLLNCGLTCYSCGCESAHSPETQRRDHLQDDDRPRDSAGPFHPWHSLFCLPAPRECQFAFTNIKYCNNNIIIVMITCIPLQFQKKKKKHESLQHLCNICSEEEKKNKQAKQLVWGP